MEVNKKIVVAKELTKLHEEIIRGTAEQVLEDFKSRSAIKGEYVIIVHT